MADDAFADEESEGGGAAWMTTFADMMTLLLTFFVLLLSFATMDITRFRMALGSVKNALGVQYEHVGYVEAVATSIIEFSEHESSDQLNITDAMLIRQIRNIVAQEGLEEVIEVEMDARGVIVRITGEVLFDPGSNDLRPDGSTMLDAVAKVATLADYPMSVEGHTDNRPIHTTRFPSNWELSTARATAAMRYLVSEQHIDPARMSVAGYADMRPLATNDTEQGRSRNRRVEFVFVKPLNKTGGSP